MERIAFPLDEAASMLGMSRRQIYRVIDSGELEAFHEGRSRKVSRRALDAYVARREEEARQQRGRVA